ncbi:MAG: hypothetical protein NTW86_02790 [Candidatus Sumerlaeota bacterium]|nr:hypothetical protein [Candidatus Sumerlaeota bacterium]
MLNKYPVPELPELELRIGIGYLTEEYRRGAVGNMPACQATDVQTAIWKKLEEGDEAGAQQLFLRLLPLIVFEHLYGAVAYKEILYRRGVIATPLCREPRPLLDDAARAELSALLAEVGPLFQL